MADLGLTKDIQKDKAIKKGRTPKRSPFYMMRYFQRMSKAV